MVSGYRRREINGRELSPETLMMSYGYDPFLSEGSVKPPIFLTSTFAFRSAEDGRDFFDYVAGRRQPNSSEGAGLVYSRFNHPNSQIVEERLAVIEGGESAAVFASGMAAISAAILAFARPGDTIIHSQPLYGGTETLMTGPLAPFGIKTAGFHDGLDRASIWAAADQAAGTRVPIIYIETPANPTCTLVDFDLITELADAIAKKQDTRPIIIVDNTMLGPVYQKPIKHGCDIVVYSLTKYVGGHSDLVAGGAIGSTAHITAIRKIRSAFGMQLDPHSCWMIGRSLETLYLRMERATASAKKIASWLNGHSKVERLFSPEFMKEAKYASAYKRFCTGGGSTFSFAIKGGLEGAFKFLNNLHLFKLAVSLGGTESLISHPASTTHSGVKKEIRDAVGVTDSLIRVSIGLENPDDLIADLEGAFKVLPG